MDQKFVTKEETTKKLHSQGELRRTTTKALKRKDLKVFVTIAELLVLILVVRNDKEQLERKVFL